MHSSAIATFLLGAALLTLTPSSCLARHPRTVTRRRIRSLQKKNASKGCNKNRACTCALDAAIEVLLHAERAVIDIPLAFADIEDRVVLARYVNDVRDCAVTFLENMNCATIQEDIVSSVNTVSPAPQMNNLNGRIAMEENGGGNRGIVSTPEQCCYDTNAIKEMVTANIKSIEQSWMPDVDGTYNIEEVMRKVNSGIFNDMKRQFVGELRTVGGIYIRELGNELDPLCYPLAKDSKKNPQLRLRK